MKYLPSAPLLLMLGFAVLPGAAARADSKMEFLRKLGRSAEQSQVQPAQQDVLTPVGHPAPINKACSASRDCGDGNTVSCTGTANCGYSIAGVKCDSNEVQCPNFCSQAYYCRPGELHICFSTVGNCEITETTACGYPKICTFIPPGGW